MHLWMAKVARGHKVGLIPTDDESRSFVTKLGDGECIEMRAVRVRSLPMHRRFFAILRSIGENQDPPRDEEDILGELKVLAGHYRTIFASDPQTGATFEVRMPKSIAFHRLTHDEWMALWPSLEAAGIERFGDTYWLLGNAA